MLAYTITNGGTYSTDAYEYKYTTSITQTFKQTREDDCNNWPPIISFTYYTASTVQLFHNGRASTSRFISYKDNNLTSWRFQKSDIEASSLECVGGYYDYNSFTLKSFTIQESDGKRTEYYETLADEISGQTIVGSTILKWTKPWEDISNVPVITTQTVNKKVYNTSTTKASFKSSFIKAGDSLSLVDFEKSQATNTDRIESKTTEWVLSNKGEKTILGYSYDGKENLYYRSIESLNFNYVDTVVFITNNNILWYITDYGEGEFTKKFKSTRGIGQQVTIKHNTSKKLEELPIGFLPYSQLFPYTVLDPVKSTISYETASRSIIDYKDQNFTESSGGIAFPLATFISETQVLTVSTSKITTKSYKKYEDTQPVENTTNYKTVLELINANTLQFHRTYKAIDAILTAQSFVNYSFGEHTLSDTDGGTTFKDEMGYTSLVKDCYSLNTEGGGEFILNKGYLNGQAAINNLSIVEQVSFKDGQSYGEVNYVDDSRFNGASLYKNVLLAFEKFAKSFTFIDNNSTKTAYSPIEDTNLQLDLRYVLISSSTESTLSNKEKYTKIETTKHEFALKGETPTTYLNYRSNNINKGLLVSPNEYGKFEDFLIGDTAAIKNANCGIFCDDGDTKSFITRIIYPGTYLAINTEGIKSSVIGKVVTLTQGIKSYYYLPWNGSIQSNGTLNLLSPSFTSASHDISNFLPEGLSSMTNI